MLPASAGVIEPQRSDAEQRRTPWRVPGCGQSTVLAAGPATSLPKVDGLTDQKTGLVPDEALSEGDSNRLQEVMASDASLLLVVEIRAAVDNVAAPVAIRRPMKELLKIVIDREGAEKYLLLALQINPQLISVEEAQARVREKVGTRDSRLLCRLARAVAVRPRLQKHAVIGLIVMALWEAGLKRLTFAELREFLRLRDRRRHSPRPYFIVRVTG